jgi:hypothetical protein
VEIEQQTGKKFKKDYELWEKYLQDQTMSNKDKINSVITSAQILETQAKRKEELAKFDARSNLAMHEEIADLYIDSIKAKIAVLENLKV